MCAWSKNSDKSYNPKMTIPTMFSGASYYKQEVDGSRSLSVANLKKGIENHQHSKLATQILITNTMGDGCVLTRAVMVRNNVRMDFT